MLSKNTKSTVRSPDGDTNFFNVVAGHARGISPLFVYILSRLRTSNIRRSNKRKKKYIVKSGSQRYPVKTMTGADYADALSLLSNAQA